MEPIGIEQMADEQRLTEVGYGSVTNSPRILSLFSEKRKGSSELLISRMEVNLDG